MKEKTMSYLEYLELILKIFINGGRVNPWLCSANERAYSQTINHYYWKRFDVEMKKQCNGNVFLIDRLPHRHGSNQFKYSRIFTMQRLIAIERMKQNDSRTR